MSASKDLNSYPKITGAQCEKLGIRPLPLDINYDVFKKNDKEKAALATAKAAYRKAVSLDPQGYRMQQDKLANDMLHAGAPKWGGFSLNGMRFGIH